MRARTTQWLVGLAIAMFLFIVLVERRSGVVGRSGAGQAVLLPRLDPRQVTRLSVRQGTNETFTLERATNLWIFRTPFLYPAQSESVERFLTRLAEIQERGRIRSSDVLRQTNGLAAFGLAPPAVTITVASRGEVIALNLGKATAIGGQVYAQVPGRDDLVTLDAPVLGLLPPTADAWRDRTLLDLTRVSFDRLQVRPLTNGFEVLRNAANRTWQMTKPWPTRANTARLEFLVQDLSLLRIESFVRDEPSAEELLAYGLQPPQRELAFALRTNEVLALQIGLPAPGDTNLVYVRPSTHGNVVLVRRQPLAPWLDSSREAYTEFCDRRLMIFDPEKVDRIRASAEEVFAVQRRPNGRWQIVEPFTAPADRALVWETLLELTRLEFLAFEREVTTDFASYGLAPPRLHYQLEHGTTDEAGATNEILAQVDFGKPTGHQYYARRLLEDSIVLALDPVRLPRAAFQLRDLHLWDVSTNDIAAITVSDRGRTRRVVRTGAMEWALAEGLGGPPNPVTLEEAAYLVGQLRAERWVAVGSDVLPRYGFSEDGHQVTLEMKSGVEPQRLTVRFGRASAAGRTYGAVTLPGQPGPVIFECPPRIYEFVLSDLSLATPVPAPGS